MYICNRYKFNTHEKQNYFHLELLRRGIPKHDVGADLVVVDSPESDYPLCRPEGVLLPTRPFGEDRRAENRACRLTID